jgi:preprotein translocase subunit SecF
MGGLKLIPDDTKIDFVRLRWIGYGLSFLILMVTLVSLWTKGLNLGIDFRGGILIEARTIEKVDLGQIRSKLTALNMGDLKLQEFGTDRDLLIRMEKKSPEQETRIFNQIKEALGKGTSFRRVENVGAKVSSDLIQNGLYAVLFALVGMMLYIWHRFEWQYGLSAIIALFHDSVAVMGFYSLSGYEFNEGAFAAILTTVGYSINDSVVIYDRLRENLQRFRKSPIEDMINLSANETLSRTILTSGTTLLALFALYFFGGPVIENFSMPIIVGILFGTFSSIFVSSNLLTIFRPKRPEESHAFVEPQV